MNIWGKLFKKTSCPFYYTPIYVDVENLLSGSYEHENGNSRGNEERRREGNSQSTPHSGAQLSLYLLHPRLAQHIATHRLHIYRREVEQSP